MIAMDNIPEKIAQLIGELTGVDPKRISVSPDEYNEVSVSVWHDEVTDKNPFGRYQNFFSAMATVNDNGYSYDGVVRGFQKWLEANGHDVPGWVVDYNDGD